MSSTAVHKQHEYFCLGQQAPLNSMWKWSWPSMLFYLCMKFYIFSKQSGFSDFPAMVGMYLLLPSLFKHISTAVLSLKLFVLWQGKWQIITGIMRLNHTTVKCWTQLGEANRRIQFWCFPLVIVILSLVTSTLSSFLTWPRHGGIFQVLLLVAYYHYCMFQKHVSFVSFSNDLSGNSVAKDQECGMFEELYIWCNYVI